MKEKELRLSIGDPGILIATARTNVPARELFRENRAKKQGLSRASPGGRLRRNKQSGKPLILFYRANAFGVPMPVNPPLLVTRAHIGKGPGIVLLSFAAPAGELGKGSVENVEVVRIAMTHATFKEFAGLFSYTLAELGMAPPAAPANEPARRFERRPRPVPPRPVPEKEQT